MPALFTHKSHQVNIFDAEILKKYMKRIIMRVTEDRKKEKVMKKRILIFHPTHFDIDIDRD